MGYGGFAGCGRGIQSIKIISGGGREGFLLGSSGSAEGHLAQPGSLDGVGLGGFEKSLQLCHRITGAGVDGGEPGTRCGVLAYRGADADCARPQLGTGSHGQSVPVRSWG